MKFSTKVTLVKWLNDFEIIVGDMIEQLEGDLYCSNYSQSLQEAKGKLNSMANNVENIQDFNQLRNGTYYRDINNIFNLIDYNEERNRLNAPNGYLTSIKPITFSKFKNIKHELKLEVELGQIKGGI